MRDLTSEGVKTEYDLKEMFPDEVVEGISVTVEGDPPDFVNLKLNDQLLRLTMQQARDLALALRKAANDIEKSNREEVDRVNQWIK